MSEREINQRVVKYFKDNELKNNDIALYLGVDPQRITQWKNNTRFISIKYLDLLFTKYKDLDPVWVFKGDEIKNADKQYHEISQPEKKISDSVVTLFGCKDCIEKEKVISAQTKTISSYELTIDLQKEKVTNLASENAELKFLLEKRKKSSA